MSFRSVVSDDVERLIFLTEAKAEMFWRLHSGLPDFDPVEHVKAAASMAVLDALLCMETEGLLDRWWDEAQVEAEA